MRQGKESEKEGALWALVSHYFCSAHTTMRFSGTASLHAWAERGPSPWSEACGPLEAGMQYTGLYSDRGVGVAFRHALPWRTACHGISGSRGSLLSAEVAVAPATV